VFVWEPSGYRVREWDKLEGDECAAGWYSLFGSKVGFTFEPTADSWGAEHINPDALEAKAIDEGCDTNIPPTTAKAPDMARDGIGAFVPKRIKNSRIYLHSGIALSRFAGAARGDKSHRRLLEAKEGAESPLGVTDMQLFVGSCLGGLAGVVLGALIFL